MSSPLRRTSKALDMCSRLYSSIYRSETILSRSLNSIFCTLNPDT